MIYKREWSICKIHSIKFHLFFIIFGLCFSCNLLIEKLLYFKPEFSLMKDIRDAFFSSSEYSV